MKEKQYRITLAQLIKEQPTIEQAINVALYAKQTNGRGVREPTEIEVAWRRYHASMTDLDVLRHRGKTIPEPMRVWNKTAITDRTSELHRLIFEAISNLDGEPLRELADAIDHYKREPELRTPDWVRARIIGLGDVLRSKGATLSLPDLQWWLGESGDTRALYRLARELNFPLTASRTRRTRNGDK